MTRVEQAAASRLGLFAHYLGIRPWEIGQLAVEDFYNLCEWLDETNKKSDK